MRHPADPLSNDVISPEPVPPQPPLDASRVGKASICAAAHDVVALVEAGQIDEARARYDDGRAAELALPTMLDGPSFWKHVVAAEQERGLQANTVWTALGLDQSLRTMLDALQRTPDDSAPESGVAEGNRVAQTR